MTMITILAASVLGSWTYSGFLAEPTPAPTPAPTPPPASAPPIPAKLEEIRKKPTEPTPAAPSIPKKAAEKPKTAAVPPVAVAAKPTRYRLTDASGQTWEHQNPTYLSSFVEARNRSFATYSVFPPTTYTAVPAQGYRSSRCYNGQCN